MTACFFVDFLYGNMNMMDGYESVGLDVEVCGIGIYHVNSSM